MHYVVQSHGDPVGRCGRLAALMVPGGVLAVAVALRATSARLDAPPGAGLGAERLCKKYLFFEQLSLLPPNNLTISMGRQLRYVRKTRLFEKIAHQNAARAGSEALAGRSATITPTRR